MRRRLFALAYLGFIALLVGTPELAGEERLCPRCDDEEKAASKAKPREKAARISPDPPPCPNHRSKSASRPPARTMPNLFNRMGSNFANNPATGFQSFLGELARMEGPELEEISLTIEEERLAGRQAKAEYLAKAAADGYKTVDDPKAVAYLNALVNRFSKRMRNRARYSRIDVALVDAPISDGQSFPGGSLVFTTALLQEPDEATVAGVVAHELAHLDKGHQYDYARRDKLSRTAFTRPPGFGESFDRMFTKQATLLGLMMNPYRPEHELEADCVATTWLFLEGYDPKALAGFFDRLGRRRNDRPNSPFFEIGRSHPYSGDRKREAELRLAQLKRWKPRQVLKTYPEQLRELKPRSDEAADAF